MIVSLDTSVLVALILEEEGWEHLDEIVLQHQTLISSVAIVEAFLVLRGRVQHDVRVSIDRLVESMEIRVIDFSQRHIAIAQDAFDSYGKGRHPAKLNFGDCIVYATAKMSGTPLLCLGDDFSKTDIDLFQKTQG